MGNNILTAIAKYILLGKKQRLANDEWVEDPDGWFTTENGIHIPLKEGQTKEEAAKAFFEGKEAQRKEKAIEKTKDAYLSYWKGESLSSILDFAQNKYQSPGTEINKEALIPALKDKLKEIGKDKLETKVLMNSIGIPTITEKEILTSAKQAAGMIAEGWKEKKLSIDAIINLCQITPESSSFIQYAKCQAFNDILKENGIKGVSLSDLGIKQPSIKDVLEYQQNQEIGDTAVQEKKDDTYFIEAGLSYDTPLGKQSPIPGGLPTSSTYLRTLKMRNEETRENPTGRDENKSGSKQGYSQAGIPTYQDLIDMGFYRKDKNGNPIPSVKNAHLGLQPLESIDKVRECQDEWDGGYDDWARDNTPWASAFGSASSRAAAYSYTAHSNDLNEFLRHGKLKKGTDEIWKEDIAQVTRELDKMFAVARTNEPMTVYRGMAIPQSSFFEKYALGKTVTDKGFSSTSTNPEQAQNFAEWGSGLVKIIVPAGASALSLKYQENGDNFSKFPGEEEILLPRNTKFKVVRYEEPKDYVRNDQSKIPVLMVVN